MGFLNKEVKEKLNKYVEGRNNAERLGMVELVAQYVVHDLPTDRDKEDALLYSKYYLSTDRGEEDLRELLLPAVSWAEERGVGGDDDES